MQHNLAKKITDRQMSAALIAAVGVVYFVIAIDLYRSGQTGLALAFAGYALANVGLYLEAR